MAPPLSPCANNTTPSFPRRPKTSTLCPSLESSPTPPGSRLTRQAALSPRERDCSGDAASAVGSDMCSNASPGQGCFYRGYSGVSSPPSSLHPTPQLSVLFHFGGKARGPRAPQQVGRAGTCREHGVGQGSGHTVVNRAPPSSRKGARTGARRASGEGGAGWVSCTLGSLKGGGEWNREGGE